MPASSPFLLAPKGPQGDPGGPVREPALSVALWLSWGAALGALACAMALLVQQTELQSLRREVSRLQRGGGPSQKADEYPWQRPWEQVSEDSRGLWATPFLGLTFPICKVSSGCERGSRVWKSRGAAIPGKETVKD